MPKRLASRLLLSHTVLAGVLLLALAMAVVSLVRMTSLIAEVRDHEFGTIDEDQRLHRAAWAIEVASRHGIVACERGLNGPEIARPIRAALVGLDAQIAARHVKERPIDRAADKYRDFAQRMLVPNICATLMASDARRLRTELDEELTNAWIDRLLELHGAILAKEDEARRIGARAVTTGVVLGLALLAAAVLIARRMAIGVTRPLAELSRAARRVGEGDFSPIPMARGPVEVEALSQELDRMRARLGELDQLKQGFVASVSHELRTPLAKVREALALLTDGAAGALNERQARVVKLAQRACEREIRIVSALLDLSRLRAGRPLRLEAGCSFDQILRAVLDEEHEAADERGVAIELEKSGEAPPACLDMALLERAVANIVRNAVSVSSRGQVVRVSRRLVEQGPEGRPGTWIQLTVKDQGPGIPEALRKDLFTAFVTHTVNGRPERVGVGLGLALAREVFRAHGGEVELMDDEAPGALFSLWLPLDEHRTMPRVPAMIISEEL